MHVVKLKLFNHISSLKCSDVNVSIPAQDLDLHIFNSRIIIADRCDTSPAKRKIFMFAIRFDKKKKNFNATL